MLTTPFLHWIQSHYGETPESPVAYLLMLGFVAVMVTLSYDAVRLTYRGTRDYIHLTLGGSRFAARLCGWLAGFAVFGSSVAPVISVVAWLGGVRPLSQKWADPGATPGADSDRD